VSPKRVSALPKKWVGKRGRGVIHTQQKHGFGGGALKKAGTIPVETSNTKDVSSGGGEWNASENKENIRRG